MTQATNNMLVDAFNKLYITYRKKFILQQSDGSYHTVKRPLNDYWLHEHIKRNQTVGVFCGSITKFICFDIDTGKDAERDMLNLYDVLINHFAVSSEYINVSVSGGKGYHIEICFNKPLELHLAKLFYENVLNYTGYDQSQVELRPLHTNGVKLPLGKHQKANRICWYINPLTQTKYELNHILNIKQLDTEQFIKGQQLQEQYEIEQELPADEMTDTQLEKSMQSLLDTLDLSINEVDNLLNEDLPDILERRALKYPNTRNKYTLLLAIYLKDMGHTVSDSVAIINDVMLNTKAHYKGFIQSSTRHIQRETEKIVKHTHKKNYTIHQVQRDVALYEDEIKDILSVKGIHLQRLYTSMLIHAKRYSTVSQPFYMAYSVMTNMGNDNNGNRLKGYINQLSDRIEVVASNVTDIERSNREGCKISKPNVYRIKKSFNQNSGKKVVVKADATNVDIFEILQEAYKDNVISLADVKRSLAKNTFIKFKQSL
ncbi:hypothetical protein CD144_00395 [Staphylococcus equorum subsp. linens]|uniref:TOTE conflict system archaeo-eukaryotic primase domain-containing protein n=1 Tax=Staphylococcus equorum TaxID=246432 RepID=UPI000CD1B049|nr:hypothetical protein [Staphylococcus equorum]PNZ09528.1 hypothetical protein CD144_00395 [Staphylococcus equorum subsp. linens]QQT19230.1 hypothetical protein I6J07_13715 [Staphylococcus equorum]